MEMNITRGLSELKLLNNRIQRKINDSNFICAYKQSAKKVDGINSVTEFNNNALADYQSVLTLIERRKKIKEAIVESNAKTMVTIAGKTMTVASAIERKESIIYEQQLLDAMERQYNAAIAKMNTENEKVNVNLNNLLNTSFGKEGKQKVTEDEITAISKPYLEQNQWVITDPLKLGEKIRELKKDIESFLAEVDFVLSESNAITKIVVPD